MFKQKLEWIMGIFMLLIVGLVATGSGSVLSGSNQVKSEKEKFVVVLDAGHGGSDPGKVGINQCLEKDINLSIVKMLKEFLEASDVRVVLTREDDNGLYSESDDRKKMADMNRRVEIIKETAPDLVVSIHQNSYHQEAIKGAQVFYYKDSEKGRLLADTIQERFTYVLGADNRRVAKSNNNYYLLLHVPCPIVIVECGFLSNWDEAAKLCDDSYQERVAWTVHMGIMQYLNETSAK